MSADIRSHFLPAYWQDWMGCEPATVAHVLHVKAPFESGWKPGSYGHSRAYIQTLSNLDKTLGDNSPDGDDSLERDIAAVVKYGTVREGVWPSVPSSKGKAIPKSVLGQAVFPVKGYERLSLGDSSLALERGEPIAAKIPVFRQFRSATASRTGRIPVGNTPPGSYHAMPMGFEDPDQFGFLNHAGLEWGDQGWCYIYRSFLRLHEAQCRFYRFIMR